MQALPVEEVGGPSDAQMTKILIHGPLGWSVQITVSG